MISLTFPDNSVREFEPGISGAEIAEGISKSLRKKAVAVSIDGELRDLSDPITENASIEIVTRDEPRALELIRHDAAHVLAEAVQELCASIISKPAVAIETGKRMFYKQIESNLEGAYAYAGEVMACNMMAADTVEGVDAFLEKRPPNWYPG